MAKKKKKDDEEEEKGGGGKVKIIGGVVGAILVYRFVLAPAPAPEPVDGEAATGVEREVEVVEGLIFPMEEIVVNLTDTDANRYLRVGLALVLEEGVATETIEPEAPRAIDAAIDYLSDQSFETLRAPGSKTVIREELSLRIREAFDDEMVVRVLLTTFVMQ
jgi:flagellar basal body-associated protein FliL